MIKKEYYKTREDGVELFRTFSDTDHKIRNKKTSCIYGDAIDITEGEEYEEVEDYVELDGAETYEEILEVRASITKEIEKTTRKINRVNLTNNQALSVKELYPKWEDKVNTTIEEGYITLYNDNLWRARQNHTALEIYPPSLDTASLYEVIVKEHEGTMEDPIPYIPPMEVYKGKYYTQFDILYKCIRDSETALTHNLLDLKGTYVEMIER